MTGPGIKGAELAAELARTRRALDGVRAELVRTKAQRDGLVRDLYAARDKAHELTEQLVRVLRRRELAEQSPAELAKRQEGA